MAGRNNKKKNGKYVPKQDDGVMPEPCSRKQSMMLSNDADIMVVGGAAGGGKSHILTMMLLRYMDCPKFRGIMFRRTFQQLKKAGNLWDKGKEIYGNLPMKIRPKTRGGTHFIWPHGPEVEYAHNNHEKDKENVQGAEFTFIGVDKVLSTRTVMCG